MFCLIHERGYPDKNNQKSYTSQKIMKNHHGGLPCGWRREASKEHNCAHLSPIGCPYPV